MNKTRYKKIAFLAVPAVAILAVLVLSTQLSAARGAGRFGVGAGGWMYDRPGPGMGPWNAPERGMRARLGQDGTGLNILRLVRRVDLTDEQVVDMVRTAVELQGGLDGVINKGDTVRSENYCNSIKIIVK